MSVANSSLSDALLPLLACPTCRNRLDPSARGDLLVCGTCACSYPLENEIPVLLSDRAQRDPR